MRGNQATPDSADGHKDKVADNQEWLRDTS